MFSHFFQNARNFRITGGNFVQIQGDQINHTTTIVQSKEKEHTELDEFYYVKRGAIYRLKENGCYTYPRRWDIGDRVPGEEGRTRADKIIYTGEIVDRPGKVFTVVEYRGPEANKAFEDDFAMLSIVLDSLNVVNVSQLYGYNKSKVPSLILYNELIPVAHFVGNIGVLGHHYLQTLHLQLGCESPEELWMDAGRGLFCRGLPGPPPGFFASEYGIDTVEELPLTVELVQEDILLRFLASFKSKEVDRTVVMMIQSGTWTDMSEQVSQPTVISTLTNISIAVANNAWNSEFAGLSDQTLLENGLTRFTLAHSDTDVSLEWNLADCAWVSQAWSVFHAHGSTLEDDLSNYVLVYPAAALHGRFTNNTQAQGRLQQPIYLFVRQPAFDSGNSDTSSLHHWSFHEDGLSPLSDGICHDLGLPVELAFDFYGAESNYWLNEGYKQIYQYQLLRNFDPTTTDFARHLGYGNIFRPVNNSDRFEQLHQESQSESLTSTKPQGSQTAGAQPAGFLSTLFSPLSSTVSNGSDILTIGF